MHGSHDDLRAVYAAGIFVCNVVQVEQAQQFTLDPCHVVVLGNFKSLVGNSFANRTFPVKGFVDGSMIRH